VINDHTFVVTLQRNVATKICIKSLVPEHTFNAYTKANYPTGLDLTSTRLAILRTVRCIKDTSCGHSLESKKTLPMYHFARMQMKWCSLSLSLSLCFVKSRQSAGSHSLVTCVRHLPSGTVIRE
jgi:hypothetical protein